MLSAQQTLTLYSSSTSLVKRVVGELRGAVRQLKYLTCSQSFSEIPSGRPVKNGLVSLRRKCMDESDGISIIV